jgi:hypothetical protein
MFSFSRFQLSAQRGSARLFILALSVVVAVSMGGQAGAQSLSGLRIGDPIEKTELLGLEPKMFERSGPVSFFKWEFVDGNTLAVTALDEYSPGP